MVSFLNSELYSEFHFRLLGSIFTCVCEREKCVPLPVHTCHFSNYVYIFKINGQIHVPLKIVLRIQLEHSMFIVNIIPPFSSCLRSVSFNISFSCYRALIVSRLLYRLCAERESVSFLTTELLYIVYHRIRSDNIRLDTIISLSLTLFNSFNSCTHTVFGSWHTMWWQGEQRTHSFTASQMMMYTDECQTIIPMFATTSYW